MRAQPVSTFESVAPGGVSAGQGAAEEREGAGSAGRAPEHPAPLARRGDETSAESTGQVVAPLAPVQARMRPQAASPARGIDGYSECAEDVGACGAELVVPVCGHDRLGADKGVGDRHGEGPRASPETLLRLQAILAG